MKKVKFPAKSEWAMLTRRPVIDFSELEPKVCQVMTRVRTEGDQALFDYTAQFDGVRLPALRVSPGEFDTAQNRVSAELKQAIEHARQNIDRFHRSQHEPLVRIETSPGVFCWRESVPIERVGFYIPGGTAPLFSTVLMLGVPAKIAGCRGMILCTPPRKDGSVHPAILYTAHLIGITDIFKVGGAQAIAAMAYGTESIPQVDKIFGPGNQYVTVAKQLANKEGLAIDMPAGPTELAIVVEADSNPEFVAADVLSQAEHGLDSQVVVAAREESILDAIIAAVMRQVDQLPRREMARQALENSIAVQLKDLTEVMEFMNFYAPEHLILAVDQPHRFIAQIQNAGSVFLGHFAPEAVGDYASGTNHTLPTNGAARAYSGVSLDSFVKKITFQELTPAGLKALGPTVEILAENEELYAHKNAVTLRLKAIS